MREQISESLKASQEQPRSPRRHSDQERSRLCSRRTRPTWWAFLPPLFPSLAAVRAAISLCAASLLMGFHAAVQTGHCWTVSTFLAASPPVFSSPCQSGKHPPGCWWTCFFSRPSVLKLRLCGHRMWWRVKLSKLNYPTFRSWHKSLWNKIQRAHRGSKDQKHEDKGLLTYSTSWSLRQGECFGSSRHCSEAPNLIWNSCQDPEEIRHVSPDYGSAENLSRDTWNSLFDGIVAV